MGSIDISNISSLFAKIIEAVKSILAALSEGEASNIVSIILNAFKASDDNGETSGD